MMDFTKEASECHRKLTLAISQKRAYYSFTVLSAIDPNKTARNTTGAMSTGHQPGLFKRPAKPHKTFKGKRSKGQIDAENRGRVAVSAVVRSRKRFLSKSERLQQAAQIRANKRRSALEQRRGVSRFKSRIGLLTPDPAKVDDVLDCIKVSDVVCFLWPTNGELSDEDRLLLTIVKAHGLPSIVNVTPNFAQIPIGKKREDARKHVQSLITDESLVASKLFCSDTVAEQVLLVRHFIDMKKNKMILQKRRPHILVEKLELADDNSGICSVLASGYLRGPTWNVNHLVHIQGWGDFQIGRIFAHDDPNPLKQNEKTVVKDDATPKVLVVADESRREPLQSEIVPDPMDAEQTWPDEFDIADDAKLKNEAGVRKVPKGTSSYQAAWIIDDDADSAGDDDEDSVDDVEKYRREREDAQFPDEVDTPINDLARIRFQKYRGLKSFRTSPWDAKENLPSDYARIFQFQNYKKTKKTVLGEIEQWDPSAPLILYQLLPHEQRMSVLNFVIRKHPSCRVPIMSKQKLIFSVGFRKFEASPIFSQHTNGNKFKMERYLPANACCVASVFAPITFPPASVLVFREGKAGKEELVATGSLLDINPDRIVLKRIVLSGHPFKINKRSVVCRYMFFNREDIEWFKPVELYTPSGRRGHIKEALGTHGHMKCRFDQQLNAADSIMMSLYKRVFPKWTYNPRVGRSGSKATTSQESEAMDD
ncbi:AARP2CN domain protein [Teladorsagia circumcincta]|uniref:Pre-rRNA-processing protein TSR1 homolog n=1 Tax=Teladorsagia circumcincta TaxID=45464 RepID=A0A2G9UYZ9_TELCI|nr:AARP2CN domain protein [Teladorsagia circumcincta]